MPLKRLRDDGRKIVQLANTIAHEYELEYVGTEHILLAILRDGDNRAARALHNLKVDETNARRTVDDLVQRSKEDTWVLGRLPGTPGYHNVIERAMEVAEQLESPVIGSEHLLLALFQDSANTAQQALANLGVTHKKCRDELLKLLSQ